MTVFYRGPCAHVTHQTFEVHCPCFRTYQSFALQDLGQVFVVQVRTGSTGAAQTSVRIGSSGLASAAMLLTVTRWPAIGSMVGSLTVLIPAVAIVILTATAVLPRACWRAPARQYELRAVYRGTPVCLFRTTDPRVFGQVRRGLVRAREHLRETSWTQI